MPMGLGARRLSGGLIRTVTSGIASPVKQLGRTIEASSQAKQCTNIYNPTTTVHVVSLRTCIDSQYKLRLCPTKL